MGEDAVVEYLEERGYTIRGRQVTIKTAKGRTKTDLVVEAPGEPGKRELVIVEVKTGPGAGLTTNQDENLAEIQANGRIPTGRRAREAGLAPGAPIPPTRVVIYQVLG